MYRFASLRVKQLSILASRTLTLWVRGHNYTLGQTVSVEFPPKLIPATGIKGLLLCQTEKLKWSPETSFWFMSLE